MPNTPAAALMVAALLAPALALAIPADADPDVQRALDYLRSQQDLDGSIGTAGSHESSSAWAAVAFARAGVDPATVRTSGGASLLDFIVGTTRPYDGSQTSLYNLERQILAIAAAGLDPRTAPGFDAVASLRSAVSDGQLGDPFLVNDDIFGLQALHAAGVPDDDPLVGDLRAFVLANQQPAGAWSYAAVDLADPNLLFNVVFADSDTTGQAVAALVATGSGPADPPVLRALAWFKSAQSVLDGGCGWSPLAPVFELAFDPAADPVLAIASNAFSTSWVAMGLGRSGQDPEGPLWSTPDGENLVTFLRGLQAGDGHFLYKPGVEATDAVTLTAYVIVALQGEDFMG